MKKLEEYKKDILWQESPNKIHIRSDILVSKRVIDILGDIKNKKIIDLGCGNNKVGRFLADKGAKVTGVDILKTQIDLAKKADAGGAYKIKYTVDNFASRNFKLLDKNFDIAIALMAHLYLNKKEFIQSLKNTHKILKHGGTFIYANIHPCRAFMFQNQKGSILSTPKCEINYFEIQKLKSTLVSSTGTTTVTEYFNHPLGFILNSIIEAGFKIKKIYEPRVTKNELKKYPNLLSNENKLPSYIIIDSFKK